MANDNAKADYAKYLSLLHITPDAQKSLLALFEAGKTVFEAVKTVSAVVGAVSAVAKMLGILKGEASEFDKLLGQIRAELEKLGNKVDTAYKLGLAVDLAELSSSANTMRGLLISWQEYVDEHDQPPPETNYAHREASDKLNDLRDSADTLLNDALWRRTFSANTDVFPLKWYRDNYRPPLLESGQAVWDYRLPLPVMLSVWQIFVLALQTIHGTLDKTDREVTIAGFADRLAEVYATILGGLRFTPCPLPILPAALPPNTGFYTAQANSPNPPLVYRYERSFWEHQNKPCGTIDTFGVAGRVETFPLDQPVIHTVYTDFNEYLRARRLLPGMPPGARAVIEKEWKEHLVAGSAQAKRDATAYARFRRIFLIRARRGAVALYNDVGLEFVWDTIVAADAIRGAPPRPRPAAANRGFHALRPVLQPDGDTLQQLSEKPIPAPKQPVFTVQPLTSLRALAQELGAPFVPGFLGTGPISLRRMLAGD